MPMQLTDTYIPEIPITEINSWLSLARLDLLPHPAGGNKWFKLKYNLLEARKNNFSTLITFGGAYSNHLYAVAEAATYFGFESVGIVRGEKHDPLNETLAYCTQKGMRIFYLSREEYRKKSDPDFISSWLNARQLNGYLIPEGGSNHLAVKGVYELAHQLQHADILATACGTGGTMAGLLSGSSLSQEVWGIPVLKDGAFLEQKIFTLRSSFPALPEEKKWKLYPDYHFGGYAKVPVQLLDFIRWFQLEHKVLLDPIYTGKLLFALFDLKAKGLIPTDKKVLALHTGGLQGWNGFPEKKRIFQTL